MGKGRRASAMLRRLHEKGVARRWFMVHHKGGTGYTLYLEYKGKVGGKTKTVTEVFGHQREKHTERVGKRKTYTRRHEISETEALRLLHGKKSGVRAPFPLQKRESGDPWRRGVKAPGKTASAGAGKTLKGKAAKAPKARVRKG